MDPTPQLHHCKLGYHIIPTIGDLIFADFKQNHLYHLSAPVSLMQDTSCESDSLPPKNSAHAKSLSQLHLNTQPKTSVDLRCFVRETTGHGWCQVQAMRIHKDPNIGFALPRMHGQKPQQLACLLSSMLNPTPNKQSPSHLDPLTTHEPCLFMFYLFLYIFVLSYVFLRIMLIGVYQTK